MEVYKQFKGITRLPNFATPRSYSLYLKPDLTVCSFSGTVDVKLTISEPTNFLVLNSLELDIHGASFTNSANQEYHPFHIVLDAESEILVLAFHEELGVGDCELRIDFSGMLDEHLRGFYKCTYMDGEEKKNAAATQFEAVDARRCFPCWDEPALKATFRVSVDVPVELTALSNMPILDEKINGDVKTVRFKDSPLMSTYLVAVVIGAFDYIEDTAADGIKVRVYLPRGKSEKGKFALSIAVKALDLFTEYFSMPYPLPKLDMVAVPQFGAGAMENYGLITYRENELLYDELLSTAAGKQRMTIVVFHEVAHHWFGNLVTMEWWTHLWLNEGFATWISYMATEWLFPEWRIWNQFVRFTTSGLHMDALDGSHPIEVEIDHARSIGDKFDEIGYEKGSAIIRMLQGYLGDDLIKKSLRAYMRKYAWSNAKTEDLWSVLSEETGIQVNSMMDGWTKQQGYPVISVELEDTVLVFKQSQFLSSGLEGQGKWIVPITLSMGSYDRCKNFLLESKVERMNLSDLFPSFEGSSSSSNEQIWIKVNLEQSGFYRVKYADELEARLKEAVARNYLSETDKLGLLDDLHAFCEACKTPLSSLLSLMEVYSKETDCVVVSKLIDVCYSILEISKDALPDSVPELKTFFSNLLLCSAEKLGWDPVPGESHLNELLRGEVYTALAVFGHDKTCDEARRRFQALIQNGDATLLSANTKKAAYVAVMRSTSPTNRDDFDALLKVYREADIVQEKERILRCIGSSPDPEIVYEVLNFFASDEVPDQDITFSLPGISLEGHETAWRWLKENWDFVFKKYGAAMLITHFIRDIISPLCSHEKADEVEDFFATRTDPSIAMNLKQSIEKVRIKAKWVQSVKQENSLQELIKQLASNE